MNVTCVGFVLVNGWNIILKNPYQQFLSSTDFLPDSQLQGQGHINCCRNDKVKVMAISNCSWHDKVKVIAIITMLLIFKN